LGKKKLSDHLFSALQFLLNSNGEKVSRFKNAAGALATRNQSEAKLAWPEQSGGNSVSREDRRLRDRRVMKRS
jgi:hypothetical protein